jgi:hypothetical protein
MIRQSSQELYIIFHTSGPIPLLPDYVVDLFAFIAARIAIAKT